MVLAVILTVLSIINIMWYQSNLSVKSLERELVKTKEELSHANVKLQSLLAGTGSRPGATPTETDGKAALAQAEERAAREAAARVTAQARVDEAEHAKAQALAEAEKHRAQATQVRLALEREYKCVQ